MAIPAGARARNIICSTVGSLPIEQYNHFTNEHIRPNRVIMQPDPRVAGSAIYSWIAEDLLLYGVAKFGCEQDIQIAGEQHGLDWCIIRPHNVYGIKQNIWDKYRNVLGIWTYQVLNNKPMTIYGDGNQVRSFSYIDDCLEPLWKAAVDSRASKQIINLGGTKDYSINDANAVLKSVIGYGETIHLEPRHEVKYAHPTWKKSVDILDYNDNTSLEDGLRQMWEWAKEQPMRNQFIWEQYELDKGIYSFWKK